MSGMMIVLPFLAVSFAALCVLWTVRITNGDDGWSRAARIYALGAVVIFGALAVTAALTICLHVFIHS
jgi:hypothetical protein